MKKPIYMDYHATTPLDPRVLEAMMPYLTEHFGNAASRSHPFGWAAEAAVEKARDQVAALIGGTGKEIVWTSGATESINLAIKGIADFYKDKGNHIVTCKTEHKAVLDTCKRLERQGYEVTYLDPDATGRVSAEQVAEAITDKTILVALMLANNEIGTIHPIEEIGRVTRAKGVFFHVDAVQGAGRIPFDVNECNVDLCSISGHKVYGPKGVGALWVRRRPRVRLTAIIDGGGHERGMRSGTLNVPGIVGFGAAAEIAMAERDTEAAKMRQLRDKLEQSITSRLDMVYLNGHREHRLPNNLNLSFAYVEGEGLMMALRDVAVSSGSACTSASLEPSHVLRACGVEEELAHTSIRFGLGRFTTEEEVDYVAELVVAKVSKLREMSPLYEMAKEGIDLKSIAWTAH
ncbi:IscS subfamily cysteine desulfurase [Vulgatibacter sp.]|uniref:IscS subfamily cysteine desulfurase n=1 Tax=Vulgatibacter sp. TaxID=1971226 RepID=UPI003563AB8C